MPLSLNSIRVRALCALLSAASVGVSAVADTESENAVRGFSGSNAQGFSGSNAQGFSGSNVQGFSGSNAQGFSGSNVEGFSGSNAQGFSGSNVEGFSGSNLAAFGGHFDVAAMGPLETVSVEGTAATLTIAGQQFVVEAQLTRRLSVGDYVVGGRDDGGGSAAIYHVGTPYVPGVSAILVKGQITSVDALTGRFTVGNLPVDYTAVLSTAPNFAPSTGATVAVSGIQPAPLGVLLVGAPRQDARALRATAPAARTAVRQ